MAQIIRTLQGNLKQIGEVDDALWNTPADFFRLLIKNMGLEFPINAGDNFVVTGFSIPSEDQKDKVWLATNRAGHWLGPHIFIDGKWQRVYDNEGSADVVWKAPTDGRDSRDFLQTSSNFNGFALIDGTRPELDPALQAVLISQYVRSVDYTDLVPVYSYFATIYLGL